MHKPSSLMNKAAIQVKHVTCIPPLLIPIYVYALSLSRAFSPDHPLVRITMNPYYPCFHNNLSKSCTCPCIGSKLMKHWLNFFRAVLHRNPSSAWNKIFLWTFSILEMTVCIFWGSWMAYINYFKTFSSWGYFCYHNPIWSLQTSLVTGGDFDMNILRIKGTGTQD